LAQKDFHEAIIYTDCLYKLLYILDLLQNWALTSVSPQKHFILEMLWRKIFSQNP